MQNYFCKQCFRYTDSVTESNDCMILTFVSEGLINIVKDVIFYQWNSNNAYKMVKGIFISLFELILIKFVELSLKQ